MLRFIGSLVGIAWVFAGWQNMPRLEHPQALSAGFAIGGTCLLCLWLGGRATRNTAIAKATAIAEAKAAAWANSRSSSASSAQVVVINHAEGAAAVGRSQVGALDGASWIGEPLPEMEQDVAASMVEDVGELEAVSWER